MCVAAPVNPVEIPRAATCARTKPRALRHTEQTTIWGHTPLQLHDRYWRSHGCQVVRPGQNISTHGTRYLLLPANTALLCNASQITCQHTRGHLLEIIPAAVDAPRYTERVIHDPPTGRLTIQRHHFARDTCPHMYHTACFVTEDRELARMWALYIYQDAQQAIRARTHPQRMQTAHPPGRIMPVDDSLATNIDILRWLTDTWATIARDFPPARTRIHQPDSRSHRPTWHGFNTTVSRNMTLPPGTIVPDNATLHDVICTLPSRTARDNVLPRMSLAQRCFDLAFSLIAITLTAPLWPVIALLIKLEDRGPVFFAHQRQGRGGRPFRCLKFRTMRPDAEQMKRIIQDRNMCDGAQFFIRDDPRQTRIGRLLRRTHLDEVPQFLNVLRGEMSVVGPRPSPEKENRFCPGWREARLSVQPGITGLWQVRRTRAPGRDFQEWLRHDIAYVRNRSWRTNLAIVAVTIKRMLIR